jgi:hypothetical protein
MLLGCVPNLFRRNLHICCRHHPNISIYSLRHLIGFLAEADCQSTVPFAIIQAKFSKVFSRAPSTQRLKMKIALFNYGEINFSRRTAADQTKKPSVKLLGVIDACVFKSSPR